MISEKRARWFLAALISVSTLGFTYLAYRKFACFRWETEDAAQFGYAFFQTLHGRFFPFYGREESLLGGHADFVQFLWYPFFRLAPSMVSLFFFQSLMISVAAWPAYLLARFHGCDRLTALIAAAGLLVFPAVVGQHVNQIHEDQYALVFLLFAFYFFEKQEFAIFGVFLVLVTLTKETFCLNTMMFGVYALLRRRRWPWVAAPVLWSAVYLFVMLRWALPAWGMGSKLQVGEMLYFSQYGHTPGEVLRYFASHPLGTLKIMVAGDRLKYLGLLLAPLLGVLAFGSWAWVPAVPSLLINLVGSNELLRHFYWHYSLIPGAILWTSFLISLPAWSAILQRRFGNRNYARIFCSIALALGISLSGLWLVPGQYVSDSACQSRRQADRKSVV